MYLKKHETLTDNSPIRAYINRIENGVKFEIKSRHYLQLLISETMQSIGNTEKNITENKNGENMSHSKITEAVLIHCSIVSNSYHQNSRILYIFVPNILLI